MSTCWGPVSSPLGQSLHSPRPPGWDCSLSKGPQHLTPVPAFLEGMFYSSTCRQVLQASVQLPSTELGTTMFVAGEEHLCPLVGATGRCPANLQTRSFRPPLVLPQGSRQPAPQAMQDLQWLSKGWGCHVPSPCSPGPMLAGQGLVNRTRLCGGLTQTGVGRGRGRGSPTGQPRHLLSS